MPTPDQLVKSMSDALVERAARVETYIAYYRGQVQVAYATEKWRETYGSLFDELADNWAQIVVDSAVERLKIEGFRFGPEDDVADVQAWQLWQANYLDADSIVAHTQACMTGLAYLLVTPGADPDTPRITIESPLQVIVQTAPEDRRKRTAALKLWIDEDGDGRAMLYTPTEFQPFVRAKQRKTWTLDGDPIENPVGVVPVVPMINNPDVLGHGMSDLTVMLSLQDAINKLLADLLVNSEYVAYPQRFVTGIEVPTNPETGRKFTLDEWTSQVMRLYSAPNRTWFAESKDAQFGSLPETSGNGYVQQIEMLVQHIAAQTRTPPHYLTAGMGQWPSGDSLKASEAGLVAKVRRKQVTFGEAWEETMRLAFAYRGDSARANATDVETIWADPEQRNEGALVDALTKMATLGVPVDALYQRWGATPQERARWEADGFPAVLPPGTPVPASSPATTNGG